MKKGVFILIISFVFLLCVIVVSEKKENHFKPEEFPKPSAKTGLAEPIYRENDRREYNVIIDPVGKERRLYLGNVNAKKKWIDFEAANPTTFYSQVEGDHYYYMRSDGKRNYTIYCDKGKTVSKFKLKSGYIDSCVKYGSKFYMIWNRNFLNIQENVEYVSPERRFAILDIKKGKLEFIPDVKCDDPMEKCHLYENQLYIENAQNKTLYLYDLEKGKSYKKIEMTANFRDAGELILIDGMFYYGVMRGSKVKFFRFDLETKQEEEILYYEKNNDNYTVVWLDMDDHYIYCQDCVIPRSGGKIMNGVIASNFNSRYLFYIDEKNKVHRVEKRNRTNKVISNIQAMSIECTENGLYLHQYEEKLLDVDEDDDSMDYQETDDPMTCHVYYMDLDGKNVEKIAE